MKRFVCILPVLALLFVSCGEKEDEVAEPVAVQPRILTAQEISQEIIAEASLSGAGPPPGTILSPARGSALMSTLRSAKTRHASAENGKEAFKIVSRSIQTKIETLEGKELWEHVLIHTDAYDIFNAGSTRFDRLREKANIELRKPKVTIKAMINANGPLTVIAEFYLPLTKEVKKERIRVGEIMHGLKFVSVIGNNAGATFTYLETNEDFDVYIRAKG